MLFIKTFLQSETYTREEKEEFFFKKDYMHTSKAIVYASIYLRLFDLGLLTDSVVELLSNCFVFDWCEHEKIQNIITLGRFLK